MSTEFPWNPVTVVYPERPLIRAIAIYDPDDADSGPLGALLHAGADGSARAIAVGQIVTRTDQEFRFLSASGTPFLVRPTIPVDAANGRQFPTMPFDLPVELIGAIVNGAVEADDANLSAAYDDDGDVHTLILETPLGLYARYSMQWIKLTDVSAISSLGIVNVAPGDLALYDDADTSGMMLNISSLTPQTREVIEVIEAPPQPAVTAAAGPALALVVASVDDLPGAIRYAESDEGAGSRWYVERRCKALGYPVDTLPWRGGSGG